jgi:hypothetical protein
MRPWNAGSCAMVLMLLSLAGCAQRKTTPDRDLTERQRDSIIATENALPGSVVVGRALATSDSAAAQAQRLDQQPGESTEGPGEGK